MTWQKILKTNFTSFNELCIFLQLDEMQKNELLEKTPFILNLPLRLAQKIQKKTLNDPILNQFVAKKLELKKTEGFLLDPTGDQSFRKTHKLLKKYPSRALVLTTSSCAMHCRFCFRKNFPYEIQEKSFEKEIETLRKDPTIEEVILSGGDPLSLSDKKLEALITQLESIEHLKRLRFHSRFIIGIPERITETFLHLLEKSRFQIWFVLHCNHPLEIDQDVEQVLKKMQKKGVSLLNQAVLLKDVNDDLETLKALCLKLVNCGVKPYYLHQLDQVEGTSHFLVEIEKGKTLIEELKKTLSGYAVPEFVQEIPFEPSKTRL